MVKYSFIIPVKEINDYIRESVPKILEIKRDDFEIIIYPDIATGDNWDKTKQIATGPGGPAMKRSSAMRDAQGDILVFVDDDAYPREDFLDKLDEDFKDNKIIAAGGPAITPADDSFWQKVSGAVFLSPLSGGCPERYASVGAKKFIDDWPSVNLSVRKVDFNAVNGFDSSYWPGEDTKLCIDLLEKRQGKILYDPNLIVYHHRRTGLLRHLKQVGSYGIHRGFFAKKYPQTSFRFKYFIPPAFLLFVIVGGALSIFSQTVLKLYLLGWIIYFIALLKAFIDIYKYEKDVRVILSAIYYIFFTHLVYGFKFLQGFIFTKELKSKLR